MLDGCILPHHVDQDDPFRVARELLLKDGTAKEDIVQVLYEPGATYMQGSEWVYTAHQVEWEIWIIAPEQSGSGKYRYGKQHFLILHFNEQDLVVDHQFEFVESSPCTPTQYCSDWADHVMRLADRVTESKVKEFPVSNYQCGVYLYGVTGLQRQGIESVTLNGEIMGLGFMPQTFFFWNLDPGEHEIALHPTPIVLAITCQDNELIFVRPKFSGLWKRKLISLEIVEDSKGRNWVKKKRSRLIYSQSGRFEEIP